MSLGSVWVVFFHSLWLRRWAYTVVGTIASHRPSEHLMSSDHLRPDRSVLALITGTAGLVLFLAESGFLFSITRSGTWVAWMFLLPPTVLGIVACGFGVAVAFFEWKGMVAGRVNPQSYTRVVLGGVYAGLVLLLHWIAIGYVVVVQLWF